MKIITFLRRTLSKLHKKDTILDVMFTFFLKQGQTRASCGPITLPLTLLRIHDKNGSLSFEKVVPQHQQDSNHCFHIMFQWLEAVHSNHFPLNSAVFFFCWHKNIKFCQEEVHKFPIYINDINVDQRVTQKNFIFMKF